MTSEKPYNITNIAVLLLLVILAAIASSPLRFEGWFHAHDSIAHLERLFAVSYNIRNGDLYPRWLSMACLGKGSPFTNANLKQPPLAQIFDMCLPKRTDLRSDNYTVSASNIALETKLLKHFRNDCSSRPEVH